MRIAINQTVQCHDQNVYTIVKTDKRNAYGHMPDSASQRLFKLNGQYAGGDRTKNVARVL